MDYLLISTIILSITTLCVVYLYGKEKKNNSHCSGLEEEKTRLEVSFEHLNSSFNGAREHSLVLEEKLSEKEQEYHDLHVRFKLAEQNVDNIKQQMTDQTAFREKTKEELLKATEASMLEVNSKLSNKLLDDHKRESEASKKASEEKIKETTQDLHTKFEKIFGSMDKLNEQVQGIEVIKQALLTPTGAGSLGEITLENILKASNLIENTDYFLQKSMTSDEGDSLKPDAIINLPDNNFMVIDSKSSKFFLEMEMSDGENAKAIEKKLKASANQHLKDLISRNYKEVLLQELRQENDLIEISNITYLMFFPTEVAIDKIRKADPNFIEKAWKESIIPVGPSGLVSLLINSKMIISGAKQEQNFREISEVIRQMLGSIATLYSLSDDMGRTIKRSMEKYDKFAGSFNHNFTPKLERLEKLGISSPKQDKIKNLERYKVGKTDTLIDITAEPVSDDELYVIEN